MKKPAVVEIKGNATDVNILVTLHHDWVDKSVTTHERYIVPTVTDIYSCLVRVDNMHITNWTLNLKSGDSTYVTILTRYPWQKHKLTANVPILTKCNNGWLKSIYLEIIYTMRKLR